MSEQINTNASEGQRALIRLLTIPPSEDLKRWLAETQKPWPEVEWIDLKGQREERG